MKKENQEKIIFSNLFREEIKKVNEIETYNKLFQFINLNNSEAHLITSELFKLLSEDLFQIYEKVTEYNKSFPSMESKNLIVKITQLRESMKEKTLCLISLLK